MDELIPIAVTVNGRLHAAEVEPRMHAADFLRGALGMTGTHVGCEQGVCGMCTIVVDGQAGKGCLMLAPQLDACVVETVEGLTADETLAPLQQAFQCGFCTPGFLMTATALARSGRRLTRDEIREELTGVLCRCTGYENIVSAVERHLADG